MSAGVLVAALVMAALVAVQLAWLLADGQVRLVLAAWARRAAGLLRGVGARARGAGGGGARGTGEGMAGRSSGALGRGAFGGLLGRVLVRFGRAGGGRRELRGACLDELPELIDVVSLGLSAGISFDAALDIYCGRYHTMLAGRLSEAMRCWSLGLKSRKEALDDVAAELRVDAFTTFAATVGESLEFGGPLVRTLVEQGEAVRERRRAEQEEAVEKTPVKMLIPVGTLTLPAMLIAILGPLFASLVTGS